MNKEEIIARPYEEYYEMIKDMSKDNMIQGLRNGWYKEVTKIEPIEKDIEFLKKHFPMPDYISRLEARIEEIKRGKE